MARSPRRLAPTAAAILLLVVAQIALGGLVAGLKAGLIYDTWPLIDGAFIPGREHLFFLQPAWTNLIDNHLTVQFAHRMVAYLLVGLAALHAADCAYQDDARCRASAVALAFVLLLQAVLGILTLLLHVPILLALTHQRSPWRRLSWPRFHAQICAPAGSPLPTASRGVDRASVGGVITRQIIPHTLHAVRAMRA